MLRTAAMTAAVVLLCAAARAEAPFLTEGKSPGPLVDAQHAGWCSARMRVAVGSNALLQPPDQFSGRYSDATCETCPGFLEAAENFVVASGGSGFTLSQLVFWGAYYPRDRSVPDTFTVVVHADAGGLPGPVLCTASGPPAEKAQTGAMLVGLHEYRYRFDLPSPCELPDGTYWVELYNDTHNWTDDWVWETGALDPVNGIDGHAYSYGPGSGWYGYPTYNLSLELSGSGCLPVANAGFESGSFSGWTIDAAACPPRVHGANPHTGSFSARLGNVDPEPAQPGDSSIYQVLTLPAAPATSTLSYWYRPASVDVIANDWQDAYVADTSGNGLAMIMHLASDSRTWTKQTFDLTPFAGQTVRVEFLVHQDAAGNDTGMDVDDVTVACCGPISLSPVSPLPSGVVGVGYAQTISASGGVHPFSFAVTAGSLPPGLSLATGGALSGSPTAAGSYSFDVSATDVNGCSGTKTFDVTVCSVPITLSPGSPLPAGQQGSAYNQTIVATGGTPPYSFAVTAGGLPSGLTLDPATGILSGIPTTSGTFAFTVVATDAGYCQGTQAYDLTIACPLMSMFPSSPLPGATELSPYSLVFRAYGASAPYSYGITGGALPMGLVLYGFGQLTGTPTVVGAFTFDVTATDVNGCAVTATYDLTVSCADISFPLYDQTQTTRLPLLQSVVAGCGFGGCSVDMLAADDFVVPPGETWTVASVVALGDSWFCYELRGERSPRVYARDSHVTVYADAWGFPGPLVCDTPAAPTVGDPDLSITLPPCPLGPGRYWMSVQTRGCCCFGLQGWPWTMSAPVRGRRAAYMGGSTAWTARQDVLGGDPDNAFAIGGTTTLLGPRRLPDGRVGVRYGYTIRPSGIPPLTFAVTSGALPPGLLLDGATGSIAGTPVLAGTSLFTVSATDTNGCVGYQPYRLFIDAASEDFLVGKGAGQPNDNRAALHDGSGAATGVSFLAYGASSWGVDVAAGDLEGDGWSELLTGPGPGPALGPEVRAFRRDGTRIAKVGFYAYGSLRYGVNVGTGGLDGDAYDEILTGPGPGTVFGPHVRGFDYDGTAVSAIAKISFFAYGTLQYGAHVGRGDLEADGFDEILTGAGPSAGFGAHARAFDYDGVAVGAIAKVDFFAFPYFYGVHPSGGDVDGDGFHEIACAPGPGPANPVRFRGFDYDGAALVPLTRFDLTPPSLPTRYGGRVGLGDVSGDGAADLLAGSGPDPAALSTVLPYGYGPSGLSGLSSAFTPFGSAAYGVAVAGANAGY